jgi:uncharacterized protein YdhG (YjbR/CyaY superfamily)
MSRDPRIDAYIGKAGDFARPILTHFRELVHKTIPDAGEAIKWGMPHFTHNGKNIAGMAAFNAHCAVIVHGSGRQSEEEGMGSYGKIASLEELPDAAELATKLIEARERIDTDGSAVKRPATRAESRIAGAAGFCGRLAGEPYGARDIRGLFALAAARICRVGQRGQAGCDARETPRHVGRMARGRQAAELEIRKPLAPVDTLGRLP